MASDGTRGAPPQAATASAWVRATAPLQIALGAKIINSTGMTIEQVVDTIVADLKQAGVVGS